MAVAFTATPQEDQGRVAINATGGVPGDSFYVLRRDRNGSNLTRETAEAGVVWQPDPASSRTNFARNPSLEAVVDGWSQTLGPGGQTSVKNLATNPRMSPSVSPSEFARNLFPNPNFAGPSGLPTGATVYATGTATGSKSSSYDDRTLTLTASDIAAGARYGLYWQTVAANGGALVPVTMTFDYAKTGAGAVIELYMNFRTGTTTNEFFTLQGAGAGGNVKSQVVPTKAWDNIQMFFWITNTTGAVITPSTTIVVSNPGVGSGPGGWNSTAFKAFSGSTDPLDGEAFSWAGTVDNSSSIWTANTIGEYTASTDSRVVSLVRNGSQKMALFSIYAASNTTYVSLTGDAGALRLGLTPGKTYTVRATCSLDEALTGTLNANKLRIGAYTRIGTGAVVTTLSPEATNAMGDWELSVTFTVPAGATEAYVRLFGGTNLGGGMVYWSNVSVTESWYTGQLFSGDDFGTTAVSYGWDGLPSASASTKSAIGGRLRADAPRGNYVFQAAWVADTTGAGAGLSTLWPGVSSLGNSWSSRMCVRSSVACTLYMTIQGYDGATLVGTRTGADIAVPANVWTDIAVDGFDVTASTTDIKVSILSRGAFPADFWLQGDKQILEMTPVAGEYFDGSSYALASNGWNGPVDNSTSFLYPAALPITIYDYEARQGLDTDYILTDELGNVGASVSVLIPRWGTWLKDPFRPFMNCKVLWHQDSEYTRKARRELLQPRNAKYPVPQWDTRIAPSAEIEVATETDAQGRALTSLLDGAGVIMVDVDDRFGVPVRYVSVGDIKGRRNTSSDSLGLKWGARIWSLEIDEVAYPIGTPSGQSLTYNQVAGFFSSYIDIAATVASYDELAAGTWKTDV